MVEEHHDSTGLVRRGNVVTKVHKVVIREKAFSICCRLAIRVLPPERCLCDHEVFLRVRYELIIDD